MRAISNDHVGNPKPQAPGKVTSLHIPLGVCKRKRTFSLVHVQIVFMSPTLPKNRFTHRGEKHTPKKRAKRLCV